MSTPSVTPIQILVTSLVALESAIFVVLQAFNVDVTSEQVAAIGGATTTLGAFLVAADAVIRHGRSRVAAAKVEADGKLAALVGPPTSGTTIQKPRKRRVS